MGSTLETQEASFHLNGREHEGEASSIIIISPFRSPRLHRLRPSTSGKLKVSSRLPRLGERLVPATTTRQTFGHITSCREYLSFKTEDMVSPVSL